MAPSVSKKRKVEDGMKGKTSRPSKKLRKQQSYDSDSSTPEDGDEFQAVDLEDSAANGSEPSYVPTGANSLALTSQTSDSTADSDTASDTNSGPSSASESQSLAVSKRRKRNDPSAFATSMTKILSSKLSTSKRSDPVLARSITAALASQELSNSRLETKVRHKLREEKKAEMDKGRVKDVLGLESASATAKAGTEPGTPDASAQEAMSVGGIAEQERRLRKTAQRGVVKLFNAVRAAQVKAEEAGREARKKGVVGVGRREERVGEMSRQGFLELIAGGGAGGTPKVGADEEA
ncbi:MAG: hypothetical protein LQ347_000868 [Umbilicaria vellea]|nr:MAG: hypothetical protein LQ347_000868 [Umbilicaria vellea]